MIRKIHISCLALCLIAFAPRAHAQTAKSEIAVGYGYFSIYSFVNKGQNSAPYSSSSGTGVFTYRYYLTKNVTLGLGIGYENISTWGSFLTFAPEVTVNYFDTHNNNFFRVRLYGSASYGISVFQDNRNTPGQADESGAKPWAFQVTPFGIRVGRQVAAFAEVGLGYKGLIHGGLAIRFPKISPLNRHKPQE